VFGAEKLTSFFFSYSYFRENKQTPYRGYTSVIESSSIEEATDLLLECSKINSLLEMFTSSVIINKFENKIIINIKKY